MAHRQLPEMPAGPILELHGQRKVFHIPIGLKLLLEECTREVLRNQPTDVYDFLANMLEDKLVIRDFKETVMRSEGSGNRRKSWQWRRWSWDGSSLLSEEELIDFLSEFKIPIEIANILALIIQSAYRGFMARKIVKGLKEENDLHRRSLWDDWRHPGNMYVSGRDVLEILAYYRISLFEANAFATKIQKLFRGHKYRKELEMSNPALAAHLHSLGITKAMGDTSASKIQSAFRGYIARKTLKQMEDEPIEVVMDSLKQKYMKNDGSEFVGEDNLNGAAGSSHGTNDYMGRADLEASKHFDDYMSMEEFEGFDGEERPKYEAFFPEGMDANEEEEIKEGSRLPPKFRHEHFGEIDPLAVREKFSTTGFKQKMSHMLKGLEEAKEDRRRANLERVGSNRKLNVANRKSMIISKDNMHKPSEDTTTGTNSIDPSASVIERRKSSLQKQRSPGSEKERKASGSSDAAQLRKPSDGSNLEKQKSNLKTTKAESRKLSFGAPEVEIRKTSLEPKSEETRKLSISEEARKRSVELKGNENISEETRKLSLKDGSPVENKTIALDESKGRNSIDVASKGSEKDRKVSGSGVEEERKLSKENQKSKSIDKAQGLVDGERKVSPQESGKPKSPDEVKGSADGVRKSPEQERKVSGESQVERKLSKKAPQS